MGTVGRKPLPTNMVLLRGNPGKRPLPMREPKPKTRLPARAPAHLGEVAKAEWRRMVRELRRSKIGTALDARALEAYCVTYQLWRSALDNLGDDIVVKAPKSDYFLQSAYFTVATKLDAQLRSWLTEFGLTPSSRRRVEATETEGDEWEAYFGGGQGARSKARRGGA
jgi:P27 family predicted phage terminase small subunit